MNRRVKAHVDSDSSGGPDTWRHFYYTNDWQVIEDSGKIPEIPDRYGFLLTAFGRMASSHRKCNGRAPANWLESGMAATYKDAGLAGPARVALRVVWCVG